MKITVISIFFPPEKGASPSRVFNMVNALKERGADVEVIASLPNYPKGKIYEGYRGRIYKKEEVDGITTRRLWLYPSKSKNPLLRIISMISFAFSLFFMIPHLWWRRPDLVIVNNEPLLTGFAAVIISKLTFTKVVTNIPDLWPLSALALGAMSEGRFYRFLEWVEKFIYNNSLALTGQSNEILTHIEKNLDTKKPLFLFRNLSPGSPYLNESAKYNGSLKIVYAGLLGVAQGVYSICQNIDFKNLKAELHIYGAGNELEAIEQYIADNPDCKIYMHEMVPKTEVPKMLTKYHATVIPLTNRIYGAVPSKIFMAVSSAMPILFSGGGEGAEIVKEHQLGWLSNPGDHETMAQNIKEFADLGEAGYKELKENCINAYQNNFHFEKQNDKLMAFLKELVDKK